MANNYYIKMQEYSISQLRRNKDYLSLCECISGQLDNLNSVSLYILKMANIDKAQGIWLDYIGWLVGTSRNYFDTSRFFSINSADLNVSKYFWFGSYSQSATATLSDELFRRRIYAKIGYNITRGTRRENIYIIKNMTFAQKVIIAKPEPMNLDITLIGDKILKTNTLREDIESILGTGVGLKKLEIKEVNDG